MRLKIFSVFGLGYASGMLTLVVALWATGKLKPPVMPAQEAQAATELVNGSPPPQVAVPVPRPVELEPATSMGKLAMPLADVDPAKLISNFAEEARMARARGIGHHGAGGHARDGCGPGERREAVHQQRGRSDGVYQFDDSRIRCYYYAHLDRYAAGLKEGMLLRRG